MSKGIYEEYLIHIEYPVGPRLLLLVCPSYPWETWALDHLNTFPNISQLVIELEFEPAVSDSTA